VFDFLGGRPVLDFLATIAERGTTDEEKLRAPRDLAEWAAQSGLTPDVMTVTPGELAAGVELREAAYRLLGARIDGTEPLAQDRDRIDAAARRRRPVPSCARTARSLGAARCGNRAKAAAYRRRRQEAA
jgi:predicted RNA-binding Zn ribbon-like protein